MSTPFFSLEISQKLVRSYEAACKPLCREVQMPQTALDILLFLANNPKYHTARDIVEIRKLKANLVSVNVDKLVREGYLERQEVPGDRRKTMLVLTDKAGEIVRRGRQVQEEFFEALFADVDQDSRTAFLRVTKAIEGNLDQMERKG